MNFELKLDAECLGTELDLSNELSLRNNAGSQFTQTKSPVTEQILSHEPSLQSPNRVSVTNSRRKPSELGLGHDHLLAVLLQLLRVRLVGHLGVGGQRVRAQTTIAALGLVQVVDLLAVVELDDALQHQLGDAVALLDCSERRVGWRVGRRVGKKVGRRVGRSG